MYHQHQAANQHLKQTAEHNGSQLQEESGVSSSCPKIIKNKTLLLTAAASRTENVSSEFENKNIAH
jgi:hypothetical protein